jgi:hypothetical protein
MSMGSWIQSRTAAPSDDLQLSERSDLSPLFSACDRLERSILNVLPHGRYFKPLDPRFVVWTLVIRSLKTMDGLLALAELGYGPQAMMLARTLIEDTVTAWWCSAQSGEVLSDLLARHERSVAARIQMSSIDSPQLLALSTIPKVDAATLQAFLETSDTDDRIAVKHWTGETIKNMARSVEPRLQSEEREIFERLLDIPYLLSNLVLHNSPAALNTAMKARMIMSRRPSDLLVHDALAIEFDALALCAYLVVPADQRSDLTAQISDDKALFVVLPEGTKAGRNDPCPCGSGRRYKSCHGRL